MNFLQSVWRVSAITILSRFTGFARDICVGYFFGAGLITDALAFSMKIPSLFRRIYAEGALNVAFVPVFVSLWSQGKKKEAIAFSWHIFQLMIVVCFIAVCLLELFLPSFLKIIFPGLSSLSPRFHRTLYFSYFTFPFIFFISLGTIYMGVLNALNRFSVPASSPIAGNIFIIGAVIFGFLSNKHGFTAWHLGTTFAIALGCSGVVQFLWVWIPCMKQGLYGGGFLRLTPHVKGFLRSAGPALLGSGITQTTLFLSLMIASFLPVGSMSYMLFAERIHNLPLSVVGTALGTVLLPFFSYHMQRSSSYRMHHIQQIIVEFSFLCIVPLALVLVVCPHLLVSLLFDNGSFSTHDVAETGGALRMYAYGLPAHVLVKILSARFFASGNTITPMITGSISLVVDVCLCAALGIGAQMHHVGIALAVSVASWVNVLCLSAALYASYRLSVQWAHVRFYAGTLFVSLVIALTGHQCMSFVVATCFVEKLYWCFCIALGIFVLFFCLMFGLKFVRFPRFRRNIYRLRRFSKV